jgi:diaminopimelate epimerase
MELEIVRADPAGNITIFVLSPCDAGIRAEAVRALLADTALKAEQVGFVSPPHSLNDLWTLEMMGGEFCGNASCSFGLLAARQTGVSGSASITVKVSGARQPLEVHVDTVSGNAEIEMPWPLIAEELALNSRVFPVYAFEGISHVIIEDGTADAGLARELLRKMERAAGNPPAACGFLFFDSSRNFLQPIVWVRSTDTFIAESSCGSGCAALGLWMTRGMPDIETFVDIAQPGGMISVHITKQAGCIQRLSISGKVTLGGLMRRKY